MEILETYKHLKITYKEFESVLKKLNYRKEKTDKIIAYINDEFDSIILLAKKRKNALVFPPSFASATYTLSEKGVIKKREDLPNMIIKERELLKKVKAEA